MPHRKRYCLIEVGTAEARTIEFEERERVIGRSEQADVSVVTPTVSRRHAAIWIEGGVPYVRDLGSGQGTFVNSHRIGGQTVLRQGDLVALGPETVFVVSVQASVLEDLRDAAAAGGETVDSSLVALALSEVEGATPERYLQLLTDLAGRLGEIDDPQQLFDAALEVLNKVLTADRFFGLLGERTAELAIVAQRPARVADSGLPPPSRAVLRRAMAGRQSVICYDAQQDPRFRQRDSIVVGKVRSVLCVALDVGEGPLGVIYADTQAETGLFSMGAGRFAELVAHLVGERLGRLRGGARLALLRARIEQLESATDDALGGLAEDLREHFARLDGLADEIAPADDPRLADLQQRLRAEIDRLRNDADRFIDWTQRDPTRVGGESYPAQVQEMEDSLHQSEVFDKPEVT